MNLPQATSVATDMLQAYAYSYPHKSSYHLLSPPEPIARIWKNEDVRQLSLYVHIPFCEMRCGFCNLFTQSQPMDEFVDDYLQTLSRQIRVIRRDIPDATFGQFAVGGGTPTFLTSRQLEHLFMMIEDSFELSISDLPTSVETSPSTATDERLGLLREVGIQRISIGVQSFVNEETKGLGRPQNLEQTHQALQRIRQFGFPVLNIDLIYGDPHQTLDSWSQSLAEALNYHPEELYLYPLYIRPQTGLARAGSSLTHHRSDLYRYARDLLCSQGYQQTSLRCFRRDGLIEPSSDTCQRDGMIGLGCGARSYTRQLHYATRFAVTQAGVKTILDDWVRQTDDELAMATHGIVLMENEQRRRFLIMSLLQVDGMPISEYEQRFQSSPYADCPELRELDIRNWLDDSCSGRLRLNNTGLEHSDEAGPLLYSATVRQRLQEFVRL